MEKSPKTYGETSALSFPSSLTLPSTSWNQGLSFFAAASMVSKPRLVSWSLHCNAIECPWLNCQPPHTWQFRSEYVIFGVMSLSNIYGFFGGWHHVKSPCVSPGYTRSLSLTTTYGQCINMNIHIYIYILYIPGTQMTLVLIGKGLVSGAWPSKIEVIWVPGIYIYIIYTLYITYIYLNHPQSIYRHLKIQPWQISSDPTMVESFIDKSFQITKPWRDAAKRQINPQFFPPQKSTQQKGEKQTRKGHFKRNCWNFCWKVNSQQFPRAQVLGVGSVIFVRDHHLCVCVLYLVGRTSPQRGKQIKRLTWNKGVHYDQYSVHPGNLT